MKDVYLITIDAWRHDAVAAMPTLQSETGDWDERTMICAAGATDWTFPAILNGLYYPNAYDRNRRLLSGTRPLPEILSANGYETAGIVASNVNLNPWGEAFDYFWNDGLQQEGQGKYDTGRESTLHSVARKLRTNAERFWLTATMSKRVPATRAADIAQQWIRARDPSTPKFVWIHLMEPHIPYYPGLARASEVGLWQSYAATMDHYRNGGDSSQATQDTLEQLYWKCIEALDERLAPVLDLVPSDAVAVIAGDHGEAFDHGTAQHGLLYDEVVKVPSYFQNVSVPERAIGQINLPAYVLSALNISTPDGWDSNLESTPEGFPLVGGPKKTCRYIGYRTGSHKIIRTLDPSGTETRETEVYHLDVDPHEQTNIYPDGDWSGLEQRVEDLRTELNLTRTTQPHAEVPEDINQRLRELGYK